MRLLGQKSRVYKGKAYFKHWIVVPKSNVEMLGWKPGQELKVEIKEKKLIIKQN